MKGKIILLFAIVLGAFLRLYSLATVPNGLTWDEAAIGYNAYSLIKTAKDEHGALLPLIFKSFGDYKPGFYIYLTVPSVAIFGLNEFAVRFPSAFFGIIAIYGIYLLVNEIFGNKQSSDTVSIGHYAALALAISPWAVHFSRGAWEVNLFICGLIFAIYFFLLFVRKGVGLWQFLILSSLCLLIYQAAKLLIPLVFLGLISLNKTNFFKNISPFLTTKKVFLFLPFLIFGAWLAYGVFFGSAGNRLSTLSILNYRPKLANTYYENQTLLSFSLITSRYFYHFSPEVLFYEGPRISERAHIPGLGLLHPLEVFLLLLGIYKLTKQDSQKVKTILFLLAVSPIPASLTLAEFSPVRALFMVVPIATISGLGMYFLYKKRSILLNFGITAAYLVFLIYSFDLYFFHSQTAFASEFNYGYKQVVQIIKDNPTKKVVFTDVYGQPYIYYLFYTAYPPAEYQKKSHFISGGLDVGKVSQVANVEFHQFGANEMNNQKDTLFIGTEGNINKSYDIAGDNVALFKQIESPDKKIIFRVLKTKP